MVADPKAEQIGLPPRPFLYTVDQLSAVLSLTEQALHTRYLFHEGRDIGRRSVHQMVARNIAPPKDKPDWRVAEKELIRWMKLKRFKYYDRGYVSGR